MTDKGGTTMTNATAHYITSATDADAAARDIAYAIDQHAIVGKTTVTRVSLDQHSVTVEFRSPTHEMRSHAERGRIAGSYHAPTDLMFFLDRAI